MTHVVWREFNTDTPLPGHCTNYIGVQWLLVAVKNLGINAGVGVGQMKISFYCFWSGIPPSLLGGYWLSCLFQN